MVGLEMGISFDKEARGVLHQEGQTRTVQTRAVKNDAARRSQTTSPPTAPRTMCQHTKEVLPADLA
jgi:hypothetical protein